jgi:hypothetical protein
MQNRKVYCCSEDLGDTEPGPDWVGDKARLSAELCRCLMLVARLLQKFYWIL